MEAVRARFQAILLGEYGAEYAIPAEHFHLVSDDHTIADEPAGVLERAVQVDIHTDGRTPHVPVDRVSGFGIYHYPMQVRVGYVYTQAGESLVEGTRKAIQDRATADRQRIESALGSWLNTGSLTPVVLDCVPVGGGGVEFIDSRAILTVPFDLLVRASLTVT